MINDESFPSPGDLAKYQKFYEDIEAIKNEFASDNEPRNMENRFNKYVEYFKKEKGINFSRGIATDTLFLLIENYLLYKYALHFKLPIISIKGIMNILGYDKGDTKTTTKKEYDAIRKSAVHKKGYLITPDTWNSRAYIVSLGLHFFTDILEINTYAEIYEKKHYTRFFNIDPLKEEFQDGVIDQLRNAVKSTYYIIRKNELKLKGKLPDPPVGRIIDPELSLDEVILSHSNRQYVTETIAFISNIKKAKDWGIKISPRVLLGGIVGTGKTLTASAMANVLQRKVYLVGSEHVTSKYIGETAKNIDKMFVYAETHRKTIILVIDEIEGLLPKRSSRNMHKDNVRAINTFLTNMETRTDIIIIGTTNRPTEIDAAAKSRFSSTIWFDYPDHQALEKILDLHFNKIPGYETIKKRIDDLFDSQFTGRNIRDLSVACGMIMLAANIEALSQDIYEKAIQRIQNSLENSTKSIDHYDQRHGVPNLSSIQNIQKISNELDDLDIKILTEIKNNEKISFSELSVILGVPAPTIHHRFNRLRTENFVSTDRTGRTKRVLIDL